MRKRAPPNKSKIETNLTEIMIICIGFVLSMLLKLKAAPQTKKMMIQKLNSERMFPEVSPSCGWKASAMIFPVMMHLETEVPMR